MSRHPTKPKNKTRQVSPSKCRRASDIAPELFNLKPEPGSDCYLGWIRQNLSFLIYVTAVMHDAMKLGYMLQPYERPFYNLITAISLAINYKESISRDTPSDVLRKAQALISSLQQLSKITFDANLSSAWKSLYRSFWGILLDELSNRLDLGPADECLTAIRNSILSKNESQCVNDSMPRICNELIRPFLPDGYKIRSDEDILRIAELAIKRDPCCSVFNKLTNGWRNQLLKQTTVKPSEWRAGLTTKNLNTSGRSQYGGKDGEIKPISLKGFAPGTEIKVNNIKKGVLLGVNGIFYKIPSPEAIAFIDILIWANKHGDGFAAVPIPVGRNGERCPQYQFFGRKFNSQGPTGSYAFCKKFITYNKSNGCKGRKGFVRLNLDM